MPVYDKVISNNGHRFNKADKTTEQKFIQIIDKYVNNKIITPEIKTKLLARFNDRTVLGYGGKPTIKTKRKTKRRYYKTKSCNRK